MKLGMRTISAAVILAATVAIGAWALSYGTSETGAFEDRPWPAFDLTYTVSGWTDENGNLSEETRRVEYTSLNEWTETVLASDVSPEKVGYRQGVEGGNYVVYYPDMDLTTKDPLIGPTIPNDWLLPGRLSQLSKESESTGSSIDGRIVLSREFQLSCMDIHCLGDEFYMAIETWHFDEATSIPLLIEVRKVDGTLLSKIQVLDLSVR